MTSCFYWIPKAALAAVIITAVLKMVKYRAVIKMWRVARQDLLPWAASFVGCLVLGIQTGIMIAASLNIAMLLWRTARPRHELMMQDADTDAFRAVRHTEEAHAAVQDGVTVLRVAAAVTFPNATYLKELARTRVTTNTVALVLDLTCVAYVDFSGVEALEELTDDLNKMGVAVYFSCVNSTVASILRRSVVWDMVHVHATVPGAVRQAASDRFVPADAGIGAASGPSQRLLTDVARAYGTTDPYIQ